MGKNGSYPIIYLRKQTNLKTNKHRDFDFFKDQKKIALLNENDISDKSIIKFLTITKLVSELKEV